MSDATGSTVTEASARTLTTERAPETANLHTRQSGLVVNVEAVAWGAVLVVAAAVRLLRLDALPLGPAESVRARAAYDLANRPLPFPFDIDLGMALTSRLFAVVAPSATTVRVVPALLGVAAVAGVLLYRPLIGRAGALVGGLLVAISPVAALASRSLGPEAAAMPFALAVPPLAFAVWRGQRNHLPVLALVVGFGLGTGALFVATVMAVVCWLGIEAAMRSGIGELDARTSEPPNRSHAPGRLPLPVAADTAPPTTSTIAPSGRTPPSPVSRTIAILSLVALIPGLFVTLSRFGAGAERLSLAAVRAWSGPPPLTEAPQPSWQVPAVLLSYEVLALLCGVIGVIYSGHRWRDPNAAGVRLVTVWLASGALLSLLWLHQEPGQLLALTLPLALVGGWGVVQVTPRWSRSTWRGGVAVLPLVPGLGYLLILALRWADTGQVILAEGLSAVVVVVGVGAAVGVGLWLMREHARAWGLVVIALLGGGLTLHALTSVTLVDGSELLTGTRTRVESAAVVRELVLASPADAPLCVERTLWPVLAWPLRERDLQRFVGPPPCSVAVVPVERASLRDDQPAPLSVPFAERWNPGPPQLPELIRWWSLREAWGSPDVVRARVVTR